MNLVRQTSWMLTLKTVVINMRQAKNKIAIIKNEPFPHRLQPSSTKLFPIQIAISIAFSHQDTEFHFIPS